MSSGYFWDLDEGFAGVVLLKKSTLSISWVNETFGSLVLLAFLLHLLKLICIFCLATSKGGKREGGWDSIHVFEATDRARTAHYKLTSTVILHLGTADEALGEMDLSGNMTRQIEQDMPVQNDGSHIINIGKLVEDMELKMRNLLRMP